MTGFPLLYPPTLPTGSLSRQSCQCGGRLWPPHCTFSRKKGSRARPDFLSSVIYIGGQPKAAPLLWHAVAEGRRRRPSNLILMGFWLRWTAGVEENRGVAIFLYSFFGETGESVEENRGVAIFLYRIYDKKDISGEENRGVAIFLSTFREKYVFPVEENEGVPVFLYTFGEKDVFCVEENGGWPIFLYIFDENVIFGVEENAGVPVFLYTFAQNHQRTSINRSGIRPTMKNKVDLACGQRSKSMRCRHPADGLERSGGAPSRGASISDDMRKEVGRGPTSSPLSQ